MTYKDLLVSSKAIVLYDGDCPFCQMYTKFIRFKETVSDIELMDAREQPELANELKFEGYDLNDGMVFVYQGKLYYGDDAVSAMALLSSPSDMFNQLNSFIFSRPLLSKVLYPILVVCRKCVLVILGKKAL